MKSVDKYFGCAKGPTIRLVSGSYLNLVNPRPEQFSLEDIASGLSKICRFGGQCAQFYSVAEHSFFCANQAKTDGLPKKSIKACLMHDAAEAFIGDVVKPLKNLLSEYEAIERRMERVIAKKFGIDFKSTKSHWKEIDRAMLIAERRALFKKDDVEWYGEGEVRVLRVPFRCWSPELAKIMFDHEARGLGIKD